MELEGKKTIKRQRDKETEQDDCIFIEKMRQTDGEEANKSKLAMDGCCDSS